MSYACSALQIVTWLWLVVQSSPTGVCQHLSVYCMSLTESGSWCGQCGQRMKQPFPDYFCISHPTACSSGWKTAWPERIGKPHTMDMTLLASGRPANIKLGSLELHSLSFMHVKGVSGFPVFHFLFQNRSHTKCNCRLNDPSCQQVSKERQSRLLAIQHKDCSLPSWKNTLAT